MTISANDIADFLPIFVPAIVSAVMRSCEASALQRELTDAEIENIMADVSVAASLYMAKFTARMQQEGTPLSIQDYTAIHEEMQMAIFENIWTLIQQVTKELESRVSKGM